MPLGQLLLDCKHSLYTLIESVALKIILRVSLHLKWLPPIHQRIRVSRTLRKHFSGRFTSIFPSPKGQLPGFLHCQLGRPLKFTLKLKSMAKQNMNRTYTFIRKPLKKLPTYYSWSTLEIAGWIFWPSSNTNLSEFQRFSKNRDSISLESSCSSLPLYSSWALAVIGWSML